MWQKTVLFFLISSTNMALAEEIERHTITSCAYQAGTAEEIQLIRQKEGDDWPTFKAKVQKIYKATAARNDLLAIAKRVYLQPVATSADVIHEDMFQACVARIQGTEPKV